MERGRKKQIFIDYLPFASHYINQWNYFSKHKGKLQIVIPILQMGQLKLTQFKLFA